MFKVLIVDDDKNINFLITKYLRKAGYQTIQAYNTKEAIDELVKNYIDIVITDLLMPGENGLEFTKYLRNNNYDMPILVITAKDDISDKTSCFNAGVDDYLVKPINVDELVLRVQALLRRAKINLEKKVMIGNTTLDYDLYSVTTLNNKIILPQKEFNILFKLFSYPDKIFTRVDLMKEFWGLNSSSDVRTVDVHINRLREKFSNNPDFEIVTMRGLGYKVIKK